MNRKRLELMEQRRREGRLPAAARAVEQQTGLPRERAVEELERRRGERSSGGGAGQPVAVAIRRLVRNPRDAGASFEPPRAAVELFEQLQAVVLVVVVEVVEVEHHRGGRRLG